MPLRGVPRVTELSRLQRAVARRMTEARSGVPDFSVEIDARMEAALRIRERTASVGKQPSINDVIVFACGRVLSEMPALNSSFREDHLEIHSRVNVGIAVAVREALFVPTILDADRKSLSEISTNAGHLIRRAREGILTPEDLAGGTFTVSNLGMFGVRRFSPIINPPQAAILAVGAVQRRLAMRAGGVEEQLVCTLTLVCDHRVVYGDQAARFLARLRDQIERVDSLFG